MEAEQCYREWVARHPGDGTAHRSLGHVLLSLGQFAEGWHEFEWRRQDVDSAVELVLEIGEVVRLRDSLRWFDLPERRPLFGTRILVAGRRLRVETAPIPARAPVASVPVPITPLRSIPPMTGRPKRRASSRRPISPVAKCIGQLTTWPG